MSRAKNVIVLRSPEISVVNGVRKSNRGCAICRPANSIESAAAGTRVSGAPAFGGGCGRSSSPANVREIDASYRGAAPGDARLTSSHTVSAAAAGATVSAVRFLRPGIRRELAIGLILMWGTWYGAIGTGSEVPNNYSSDASPIRLPFLGASAYCGYVAAAMCGHPQPRDCASRLTGRTYRDIALCEFSGEYTGTAKERTCRPRNTSGEQHQ